MSIVRWISLPLMAGLLSLPALAQTKPADPKPEAAAPAVPAAPAVEAEPQTTSATFGDWVVRCQRLGTGTDRQRVCEAAQSIRAQAQGGTTTVVAEIGIGRLKKADPLRITVVLPVSVEFPSAPKINGEGKDPGPAVDLAWKRCLPGGCFAEAVLKDDQVKRWRGFSAAGAITTRNGAGQDMQIAMSFRGLAQALDALAKEP